MTDPRTCPHETSEPRPTLPGARMTDEPTITVHKYATRFTISAEALGLAAPRPADPVFEARKATAAMVIPASIHALDALTDPVSRVVLDLHRRNPDTTSSWICEGCDIDGYECEQPRWPCRTAQAIAAAHGIDLTDDWLYDRPADGSLDLPTTSEDS